MGAALAVQAAAARTVTAPTTRLPMTPTVTNVRRRAMDRRAGSFMV